jgi:mannose-1-phosphate guanylyltransferase
MAEVYAVIMAGGRGERFWPLSTEKYPKPFIPLLASTSLIEDTVERLRAVVPVERILICLGRTHLRAARECLPQIPERNLIVEPLGRDTSACLGYCALHLERRDPEAFMLALPADHYISEPLKFQRTLGKGIRSLPSGAGIVFGIVPDRPETSYGYIRAEKPAVCADAWPVVQFVEKPTLEKATEYLRSGHYFWNSGIFLWRNRTLLELFQKHMPETYRCLDSLRPILGRSESHIEIHAIYSRMERISIDFGILEKASGLRMIPADFAWDDIGSWASLARALPGDSQGNVIRGEHVSVDSTGCLIYSDTGMVATLGVSDLVIVQAHGKVLVCRKNLAAELKRLVSLITPKDDLNQENFRDEN